MSDSPLDYLLTRRSVKFVQAPGPSADQLDLILRAAMCAPDHGATRPWRFCLVRGAAIPKLLDIAIEAGEAAGTPIPAHKIEGSRRWLADVPLMIAIACKLDYSSKIPEHERLLAVGAAVTNILNAAHMLGFSAYWSTGIGTYLDGVGDTLGFDALDYRFMGYLSIGTPTSDMPTIERPDYQPFVTEWVPAE
ncbi:nitroreductase [Alcaligenaceae bacterium CGII-47]|nr:nitroreductase [Alcaligenaceae bacterium CGII-47]